MDGAERVDSLTSKLEEASLLIPMTSSRRTCRRERLWEAIRLRRYNLASSLSFSISSVISHCIFAIQIFFISIHPILSNSIIADDGEFTVIGTWTLENAKTNLTNTPSSFSISLDLSGTDEYASYGLIFNSMETSTLGAGAGMAADITNIRLLGEVVPEPATASLGLFGLGALLLRRRRN